MRSSRRPFRHSNISHSLGHQELGIRIRSCRQPPSRPTPPDQDHPPLHPDRSRERADSRPAARQFFAPPRSIRRFPNGCAGQGRGWLTAEYNMLPGSTRPRKKRDRDGKSRRPHDRDSTAHRPQLPGGRRSRRSGRALDRDRLRRAGSRRRHPHGQHHRGFIALVNALGSIGAFADPARRPLTASVAAISIGIVAGQPLLDLDYSGRRLSRRSI